jgi:hypothetical protein
MDGKSVAIGLLALLAVFMGGLVASGLRQDVVYAQGGVYATYLATSVLVRDSFVNWAIIDTDSRRMIIYDMDTTKFQLNPVPPGRIFAQDFPAASRTAP